MSGITDPVHKIQPVPRSFQAVPRKVQAVQAFSGCAGNGLNGLLVHVWASERKDKIRLWFGWDAWEVKEVLFLQEVSVYKATSPISEMSK